MSSRNPSRDASLEPPDRGTFRNPDDDAAEHGAPQRGRRGTANPASSRTVELVRRFKALQKEYLARQRKRAHGILAANKAAIEAYLPNHIRAAEERARTSLPIPRIGDVQTDVPGSMGQAAVAVGAAGGGGGGSLGIPKLGPAVLQLPLSDRRVTVKPTGNGQLMRSYVRSIPAVQSPPSYTTWSYLNRNELARDHGRRMFLVDEVGETVPADDGETEERLPWEDVDGAAVDWAMAQLAEEGGWDDPDVLEALMEALRPQPQPEAICQRLAYLQAGRQADPERRGEQVEGMVDEFGGSFCRRCRVYGCRTHSGGHVKPHHRAAPLRPDASKEPCGPDCWKVKQKAAAPGGGGGGTSAGVAGRRDGGDGVNAGGGDAMEVDSGAGQQPRQQPGVVEGSGSGRGGGGNAGAAAAGGSNGSGARPAWSTYELSMVKRGLQVFGAGNPCSVALLLGGSRMCAEVKEALERIDREQRSGRAASTVTTAAAAAAQAAGPTDDAAVGDGGDGGEGGGVYGALALDGSFLQGLGRVPARRKGARTKKAVLTNKSTRSLVVSARAQHGSNDWHEYQPCTCMGKCKADCPCVRAHNFCEKFCACSTACRERFRGCTCKSGCKNNQCPCWAAGRECDPDLCGGCAPTLEARAEAGRECHNMRLRMRQHAHVVLGTSDIPGAGWGLFAAQYVAKNGFLGEYTGDLITQDEANRRGSVYDHMNNSYLFNLNNEWVVDAKFRGNKLRCANHSHEPVAKAKVLLVDGESRIAILADKHVTPGMEITYDYRYSDETAPLWVKKKQQRGQ